MSTPPEDHYLGRPFDSKRRLVEALLLSDDEPWQKRRLNELSKERDLLNSHLEGLFYYAECSARRGMREIAMRCRRAIQAKLMRWVEVGKEMRECGSCLSNDQQ